MDENNQKVEGVQEASDIDASAPEVDLSAQKLADGLTVDYVFSAKDSLEVPDQIPQKSEFFDEMNASDPNITIDVVEKVEDHQKYDQFLPTMEPNAGAKPVQPVTTQAEAAVQVEAAPAELVAAPLPVQAVNQNESSAIVLEQDELEQNHKHEEVHYEALEDGDLNPSQKRRFSRLRLGIICLAVMLVLIIAAMIFSFVYGFKTSADQMISDSARASDITNMISAIGAYRIDHDNKCPVKLEELYAGYISKTIALNIRKDYVYKVSNSRCTISVPFDNEKNLLKYGDDLLDNGFWYDRVSAGSDS